MVGSISREKLSDVYPGCQSYSAHDGQEGKSSGEPWNKIVSDWCIQVPTRAVVKRVACLNVSGFFPRNVEVNTPGQFLISAIPKQHLGHQLGRIQDSPIFK